MGHGYQAVQWNPFKRWYDLFLLAGVATFLVVFVAATFAAAPPGETWSEIQVLMRAFGACAFALLHVVLMIGPLARLSPRFKPFLYNRRHMGVTTFILGLLHAALVLLWYHGFSDLNVFVSLFASNPRYDSLQGFPFESLGFVALVIFFIMAATSHDFWNTNLGPAVWKTLHMGVYLAYALLVGHVMLGVMQLEKDPLYAAVVGVGAGLIAGLHLIVGWREWSKDRANAREPNAEWVRVAPAADIPENKAVIVALKGGERVAVFRYDGKVSALSNVCRHQGGPLGEGCVKDGLVTCPWHSFQYRPEDGASPPPFNEKVPTYKVRVTDGVVFIDPKALPPGTPTPPAAAMEAAE
ncbi:MAG: ferric reductase-like transmembrane domain-containing protein [Caulobacterales bacterium]|nr:ferric reductase-like transmembrane domain-containing protein [Caulobacterales bacterium]